MVGGVVYEDLVAVPAVPAENTTTVGHIPPTAPTMTDRPTESHALAMDAARTPEELGAAQLNHDAEEVMNLGWYVIPRYNLCL
jgi:hypothetical protein